MSEKDCDNESCSALNMPDFKNALKEFQKLVEKTVAQKTEERLALYIKDGKRLLLIKKCNFLIENMYQQQNCRKDIKLTFKL